MWNAQRGGFSSCTATCSLLFARLKNATQEKIWLTKGQFSLGPPLCCSRKPNLEVSRNQLEYLSTLDIIVHPRQRHKKSFVWGGGRDSPFHIYSSVSSCNHLIQNLGSNLHWKWGDQGGNMVGPSGETRKPRRKVRPGLIRWVMRISWAI